MGLEEKSQERELEGVMYQVTPVPFGVGRPALVRFYKLAGPVIAAAFRAEKASHQVAALVESIAANVSDADLEYFAKLFGTGSKYADAATGNWIALTPAAQELHFAGEYGRFMLWLKFAIEVNFARFFSGLKSGAVGDGLLDLMTGQAKAAPSTGGNG